MARGQYRASQAQHKTLIATLAIELVNANETETIAADRRGGRGLRAVVMRSST
jgi:hypothetical protein